MGGQGKEVLATTKNSAAVVIHQRSVRAIA